MSGGFSSSFSLGVVLFFLVQFGIASRDSQFRIGNFFVHNLFLNCKGIEGRGGLHCLSRDESRRAYEASHLG
jgi:hypothetical protein